MLLHAYRDMLVRARFDYKGRYFDLLRQLSASSPDEPFVLSSLSQQAMMEGRTEDAIRYGTLLVQTGSKSGDDYLLLGEVLARAGRTAEAIEVLKKGLLLA